ncbi:MAG: efflux RND transporter periplasmic adaptor subunit [Gammaproteobacteria bacterium]|nr:efflux RND transporter periplasmic adaptor subunit [Gammaproteobacteria bacterium]
MRHFLFASFIGLVAALIPPGALSAQAVPVIVAEVRVVTFVDEVEALGTLRANESITLTASVTETVSVLHFDDGDRVTAGQVLVEMTDTEEQAQLREARALEREAASQYRRVESLATQGTAAKSLLDERDRQWKTARARLVAIESRLSDRLLKAPFSGVMGLRNISVGALVEPGDLIATLDDDTMLKLDLSVPSVYLASMHPGIPIVATTRAYGDRVFHGTVRSIDSRVDPVTRSVVARVLLPNDERLLKPGMLMQVRLRKNERQAMVIPEAALMPLGRLQFVLVADPADGALRARKQQVEIGSRRPGEVEILAGLKPGERVVTHGMMSVRPGQEITVKAVDDGSLPIEDILRHGQPAAVAGSRQP